MHEEITNECPLCSNLQGRNLLVAGLLIGGAAMIFAGLICWRTDPPKAADRLLNRARRKIQELEDFIATSVED